MVISLDKKIYYKDKTSFSTKVIYVHSALDNILYTTNVFDAWDLPKYKYLMEEQGILYESTRYLGRNLKYVMGNYMIDIFNERYTHILIEVI